MNARRIVTALVCASVTQMACSTAYAAAPSTVSPAASVGATVTPITPEVLLTPDELQAAMGLPEAPVATMLSGNLSSASVVYSVVLPVTHTTGVGINVFRDRRTLKAIARDYATQPGITIVRVTRSRIEAIDASRGSTAHVVFVHGGTGIIVRALVNNLTRDFAEYVEQARAYAGMIADAQARKTRPLLTTRLLRPRCPTDRVRCLAAAPSETLTVSWLATPSAGAQ